MSTKDVVCSIGCGLCREPVQVSSRDMEDNVKQNGTYTCWTCLAEMEDQ